MRTNSINSDWHVARPIAVAGRTFAVLALLFCIAAPFVNDLPQWTFLLGGFAYSAFLAFFVTGYLLLPKRVFTTFSIGGAVGTLLPFALLAALHFDPPLPIIEETIRLLLWALWTFLVVMFALACYSWYRRFAPMTHPRALDRSK